MRSTICGRYTHFLSGDQASIGTWLTLGSPRAATRLAKQGFTWLGFDLDGAPDNECVMRDIARAIQATPAISLVRVPANAPRAIRRARDLGASGVLLSHVESREDAEFLVNALRDDASESPDQPAGSRRSDSPSCGLAHCDHLLRIVMLETARGLTRAEEILAVDGIDACFVLVRDPQAVVGGLPPGLANRTQWVHSTCSERGIAAGIQAQSAEQAAQRVADGWSFVAVGSDQGMLDQGATDTMLTIQEPISPCRGGSSVRGYEAGCAMSGVYEPGAR